MGHGYRDTLITWLAGQMILMQWAMDGGLNNVAMQYYRNIKRALEWMPNYQINTASVIQAACMKLSPYAQRHMANVLLGLPS